MDYLRQLNEFDRWQETHPMPSSARLLWFVLMQVNNRTGWAKQFTVPVSTLMGKTGLSRRAVYDAREMLEKKGLIKVKQREGMHCGVYEMCAIVCKIDNTICTINNTNTDTKTTLFTPPSLEEVTAYCLERANGINARQFIDYYAMRGWKAGSNDMRDWRAAVRSWENRERYPKKEKMNENLSGTGQGRGRLDGITRV